MFDEAGKYYANDIRAIKSEEDQQTISADLEEATTHSIPDTTTDIASTVNDGDEEEQQNQTSEYC